MIDDDAVAALSAERLDWRFKAIPAGAYGLTVGEYVAARPYLEELGTPLLTLDAAALDHNIAAMAGWVAGAGVELAPHGKTTMAPSLWRRQLAAGAWGITVANLPQLRVARAFGVRRILLANSLLDPAGLTWMAAELAGDENLEFSSWVDSMRSVELMDTILRNADTQRPVDVCVELGGPSGRTGVRVESEALEIAEAVRRSPVLRLAGLAGYEGAVAQDATPDGLAAVETYLRRLAALHPRMPYEIGEPMVTAGGSSYFDQVVEHLGGLDGRVVLRSGAYVIHDDGFYREISPFSRGAGKPLRSAMHGWARTISTPEPGLALLDAGKRDLPFDEGLPMPQFRFTAAEPRRRCPSGAKVTALKDQHTFLEGADVEVGDVVRFGLSHPCTALDKWTLIPVVADADAERPVLVDLIRTWF